jgi:hypothetical protein
MRRLGGSWVPSLALLLTMLAGWGGAFRPRCSGLRIAARPRLRVAARAALSMVAQRRECDVVVIGG